MFWCLFRYSEMMVKYFSGCKDSYNPRKLGEWKYFFLFLLQIKPQKELQVLCTGYPDVARAQTAQF
ncbi:hypothetical protein B6N25_01310 [Sphingobacteriales bacterium TSM_CSS]|nr:hypothetical protein B6N25_01310 [Sphingobacteriales bacterium TSM_CSS]